MDIEYMETDKLLEEYDKEYDFITAGKDSTDDICISLSRLLEIERELSKRSDI